MAAEHELSAVAAGRMDALLPELLGTLRARVRRARRRRAVAALVVLAIPALLLPFLGSPPSSSSPMSPTSPTPLVATSAWSEVRDDPRVLARCEVASVARTSWFAGDDELQALLRAADRPAGLVRAGERVFVSADAIDPWPGEAP